jgi:Sulfotransferase family
MSQYEIPEQLDYQKMVDDSRSLTGLDNVGEPDIHTELRRLVSALNEEARLNAMGKMALQNSLTQVLVKRLKFNDILANNPQILDEPILGPVIITGLPRSGTTKMHRMIAANPDFQKLPLWKILNPVPIGPIDDNGVDPRIHFADEASRITRETFPEFYAGHPMNTHDVDEEEWMLELVMRGYTFNHTAWVPSIETFMDAQNFDSWYAFLKKLLQYQQWFSGDRGKYWLIKAPSHLRHMKLLFKHFPNAVIIHCHRDPATTVTSLARLMERAHRMYSDWDHPLDIGDFTLSHWSAQMAQYMEIREELERDGNHQFHDIAYRDITGDTLSCILDIFSQAGVPVSEDGIAAMQDWDANNPPGKHGKHSYSIDRFNMTPTDIHTRFQTYLERFGDLI